MDLLHTSDFVSPFSSTTESGVPLDGTTLKKFDSMSPTRQRKTVQAAESALPDGAIAHRLGDFVFTYHGMVLNECDPNLWIVIMSPDPDSAVFPASSPFQQTIVVGHADGSVEFIPVGLFAVRLSGQNRLRAKENLPPLPDPKTVTHGKPAVGK